MSLPLIINGVTYNYPEVDDVDWGPDATDWASAVTSGMLQKAGGLFQLLAEADFGTGFGLKSLYYKSRSANPADAGQIRLARADVINWRNQANGANLSLGVSSSNILQFNGVNIQNSLSISDTTTIDLTFAADSLSADIIAGSITNSLISTSAAIAFSKLATLADGNILVGSALGVATSVAVTGDVTITNAGVTAIGTAKVVNAMLANMAQSTFKGRAASAGTGVPVDLTATQATAILNIMVGDSGSGGTKGLVPAPTTGDATKFLRGDASWGTPSGAGDVNGPGSATDNGFARFDGTTGKLIKNSPATITNADVVAAAAIAVNKLAALTISRAVVTDGSGFVSAATTTATEIGYVNGVTSAIQTQINTKLPTTITTTGDLIYSSSGTTASPLAIGTTGKNLKVVSGLPAWSYPAYRAVTTTDAPTLADDTLNCSGASFTITFPTAVGCAGKQFTINHSGTSLSQVYTLATTSSQTIGGIATGVYKLVTNGESLTFQSDNANWIITNHTTNTAWSGTFAVTAAAGFGVVTASSIKTRRVGDTMACMGSFTAGTAAASTASLGLPIAIDTTKIQTGSAIQKVGYWTQVTNTSQSLSTASICGDLFFDGSDTANIYLAHQVGSKVYTKFNVSASIVTATPVAFQFYLPVSTWQP